VFFQLVLSAWLVMTLYVRRRASSVRPVARRVPRWLVFVIVALLGLSYPLGLTVRQAGWLGLGNVLERAGVTWIGMLFLLFVALLAADLTTGFGLFFRRFVPAVRAWALVAGGVLAAIAVVQGLRAPAVSEYEIAMPGLPAERDGTTLVFISDLHLGTLVGKAWLDARIGQIGALRPDAIIIGGDVLEGDDESERALLPVLARLSAPLGVWAVAGNHEHHGGGGTVAGLRTAGMRMLLDQWTEVAPGLLLAGVEDSHRRGEQGNGGSRVDAALAGRPPGAATILASHAPEEVERAARAGVGLMLSGHTHDGQIWPFRYLIRLRYRYLAGRYEVEGMPLLVCRGTGTFGPRMRLWRRSEILRITLRRAVPS
jgi:uncharacterized protein